jgi:alkyl sulfatase BDS1-like metallo-beta-lactamase superfamily hydrolase
MTDDVLAIADRLWREETAVDVAHLFGVAPEIVGVADGTVFLPGFANVSAFLTEEGLAMVDTGSPLTASAVHAEIRRWRSEPLRTAVYSHGHIDHVFGVGPFDDEADDRKWPRPVVLAHEGVPARFERYVLTAGYNEVVNRRQFQVQDLHWPVEYRLPDRTYRDVLRIGIGGESFELHHAKGETDDHTWTWVPGRRVLCCGDLFIWACPNAGNPQKVQRYPLEWAAALRTMAGLQAEYLLPGHGLPVVGADRVHRALTDTAELLESLVGQALELMNAGARLDDLIHTVAVPSHLGSLPYLKPIYDEPEFVVRNVWRLYGGWYDGNPATLHPARDSVLARELASLVGGAGRLAARAVELLEEPDDEALRLAGHLAEFAALAAPDDPGVHEARAAVFGARRAAAASVMARGIYAWAESESGRLAGERDG